MELSHNPQASKDEIFIRLIMLESVVTLGNKASLNEILRSKSPLSVTGQIDNMILIIRKASYCHLKLHHYRRICPKVHKKPCSSLAPVSTIDSLQHHA